MNPRHLLMMLARVSPLQMFAIIVSLSAGVTWLVSSEITRRTPEPVPLAATPVKQKATVLICTRDLEEGAMISADDVAVRLIDQDRSPVDALTETDAAIGRTIKFPVASGTLLSMRDLTPLGIASNSFQAKLRAGERAITLAVDSTTGVAGFIGPDSHVDVMVQVGGGAETKTQAILSDVRVVASGTTYQKVAGTQGAVPASTVTVAVEPKEAAKLISAMAAGRIYLTLRSDRDHTPIAVSDINSLFRHKAPDVIAVMPQPEPLLMPSPALQQIAPPEDGPRNPMHEIELYAGANRNVITTSKE
jgi:pilus assembly protein CpaB